MRGTLLFNNIKLYGFHGSHSEELQIGNYFIINIKATLKNNFLSQIKSLNETIDYENLYESVKREFEKRENIIENVALNIIKVLITEFPQVDKWTLKISKENPTGTGSFYPEFVLEN
ncbi:MAG: dihydroneopterin aldolase [Bacteroidia bacterium]|nr:dihydroneopterin aldolase [Bacteroidia bacterium]